MSMTHEEVRAAADAIMPPDAEIAEAMRCLRVVRELEGRAEDNWYTLGMGQTLTPSGYEVAFGRDIEPAARPTLLAALEAALGIEAEEEAAGLIARRMLNR